MVAEANRPRRQSRLNRLPKRNRVRGYALVIWREQRHDLMKQITERGIQIASLLRRLGEKNRMKNQQQARIEALLQGVPVDPALVENLIQGLARVVVSQALIRVARAGYKIVNTEHDSLWVLIPRDGHEAQHVQYLRDEMSRTPDWLPGLPLACECEVPEDLRDHR